MYKLIDSVKGKTFSFDIEEQMLISDKLYGQNIKFNFTRNDVINLLNSEDVKKYSQEERERVIKVILEQMRKYSFLF